MPTIASMISEMEQRKKQEERISKQIETIQNLTNELSNNGFILKDLSSTLKNVAEDFGGAVTTQEDLEKYLETINELISNNNFKTLPQSDKFIQIPQDEKENKLRQLEEEVQSLKNSISDFYKLYEESSDNTGNLKEKISKAEYFGSVAHFRAWMDRFLAVNGKSFTFEYNAHKLEYQVGYFSHAHTSTREVWNVYIDPQIIIDGKRPGDSMFGLILAVEYKPNYTVIEFIDGHCYERTAYQKRSSTSELSFGEAYLAKHKMIGENFTKIANAIKAEIKNENNSFEITKEEDKKVLSDKKREINLQTKPAGRKIDPWNPLAYDILVDGKEEASIRAFRFWCEKQAIKDPGNRERDAFKKAMKREEDRRNGTN